MVAAAATGASPTGPTKRLVPAVAAAAIAGTGAAVLGLTVWPQAIPVLVVVGLALLGVRGSNWLHDRGFPATLSRRFAPAVGGLAYLACALWLEPWTAVAVSAAMTAYLAALRLSFRNRLRGVRGTHSAQTWAEITYPLAGTLGLAVGWGILGDRWLGFVPVAFMAWGDTTAGLMRDTTSPDRSPTLLSLGGMFAVCLIAAAIFARPVWIGAAGALAATLVERYRLPVRRLKDDNIYIVGASLGIMALGIHFLARA